MDAVTIAHYGWCISLTDDVRVTDRHGADATPHLRKARAIIAILACTTEHRVARSDLIALVWSDRAADQARASLRQCLFTLRTEVPELIEADFDWAWLAAGAIHPPENERAQASLARLTGLDPALDNWLAERRTHATGAAALDAKVGQVATQHRTRLWRLAAIACLAIVAAIFGTWSQRQSTDTLVPLTVIRITPFVATPNAGEAAAVAVRLGENIRALLPTDRAQVRISEYSGARPDNVGRRDTEWVISGSVDARKGEGKAHVQIATADGTIIWGREIEAASGRLSDAGAIASTRIAMATGCALGGPRVNRNADVLSLLFAACERLDFSADNYGDETALVAMQRLADAAPDDALAQAYFGTGLAIIAFNMPPTIARAQRLEAVHRLDLSQKLDSRVGEAWLGRSALIPDQRDFARKELTLASGLAVEPNNVMLNLFMGELLTSVGRGTEGLLFAQRAAALGPAFLATTQITAGMLSAADRPREALALLDLSDRRFPNNHRQAMQRLDALLTSGDTVAARALLDRAAEIPGFLEPARESFKRRLSYAMDAPRGPLADIIAHDAAADADAKPDFAPRDFNILTQLGRIDAAIALGLRHTMPPEVFFRRQSRPVLLSSRFPALARRAGLWDYWHQSGHWPDVCREPQRQWTCGPAVKSASFSK